MPRGKDGSIIGDAVAVSSSSASGIWTMSEVHKYKTEGVWPAIAAPTGGVVSAGYPYTGYNAHKFHVDGNFIIAEDLTIDIVLVAGGGGGSCCVPDWGGGGGGAGGMYVLTSLSLTAGTYAIEVGDGGAETNNGKDSGDKGEDTTFKLSTDSTNYSLTAFGGGGGTYSGTGSNTTPTINTGGSGGGHSRDKPTFATGGAAKINGASAGWAAGTNFNNAGSTNASTPIGAECGGGGGAGGAPAGGGGDDGRIGGAGSNAFLTDVSNTAALLTAVGAGVLGFLAGGGGGGANDADAVGAGGSGGGGDGGFGSTNVASKKGEAGTANTGSGGGGMGRYSGNTASSSNNIGGAGGSGIVIIRYAAV